MKKILVSFLSFMVILGVCLGISQMVEQKKVKAESVTSQDFVMQDGASFRSYWSTPNCGITYMATMPNGNSNIAKVKLFVAPYDYVESIRGSSTEAIDYVTEFTQAGKQFLDIEPAKVADSTKTYFTGGVKNISAGQESRKWFGIYYYNDGSENIYAQMPNGEMGQARSIAYLSSGYYNSGECTSENDKYMTSFYMDRAIKTAVSKSNNTIDTSTINYFDGEGKNTSIVSGQVSGNLFDDYLTLSDIEIEIDGVDNPVNVGKRLNFAVGYNANNYVENAGSNTSMYVNTKQVATNQVVSGKIGKDTTSDIKVNIGKYDLSKATMVSGENITFTGTLSTENNQLIDSYNSTNVTPQGIMLTIPKNGKVLKAKTLNYQQLLNFGGSFNFTTTSPSQNWSSNGHFKDLTNANTKITLNLTATLKGGSFISSVTSSPSVATKNTFDLRVNYTYSDSYDSDGETAVTGQIGNYYYGQNFNYLTTQIEGYTAYLDQNRKTVATTGTISGKVETNVYYMPNTYTYTVNYTGATSNPSANTVSVKYGYPFKVNSPSVLGYMPNTSIVSGVMPANNMSTTVNYSKTTYSLGANDNVYFDGFETKASNFINCGGWEESNPGAVTETTQLTGGSFDNANDNTWDAYYLSENNKPIAGHSWFFRFRVKVNSVNAEEGTSRVGFVIAPKNNVNYKQFFNLVVGSNSNKGTNKYVTVSEWTGGNNYTWGVKTVEMPYLPNYSENENYVTIAVWKAGGTYNVWVNEAWALTIENNNALLGDCYIGILGFRLNYSIIDSYYRCIQTDNFINGGDYTNSNGNTTKTTIGVNGGYVHTTYGWDAYYLSQSGENGMSTPIAKSSFYFTATIKADSLAPGETMSRLGIFIESKNNNMYKHFVHMYVGDSVNIPNWRQARVLEFNDGNHNYDYKFNTDLPSFNTEYLTLKVWKRGTDYDFWINDYLALSVENASELAGDCYIGILGFGINYTLASSAYSDSIGTNSATVYEEDVDPMGENGSKYYSNTIGHSTFYFEADVKALNPETRPASEPATNENITKWSKIGIVVRSLENLYNELYFYFDIPGGYEPFHPTVGLARCIGGVYSWQAEKDVVDRLGGTWVGGEKVAKIAPTQIYNNYNKMSVLKQGATLTFMVNGVPYLSVTDSRFTNQCQVGFMAIETDLKFTNAIGTTSSDKINEIISERGISTDGIVFDGNATESAWDNAGKKVVEMSASNGEYVKFKAFLGLNYAYVYGEAVTFNYIDIVRNFSTDANGNLVINEGTHLYLNTNFEVRCYLNETENTSAIASSTLNSNHIVQFAILVEEIKISGKTAYKIKIEMALCYSTWNAKQGASSIKMMFAFRPGLNKSLYQENDRSTYKDYINAEMPFTYWWADKVYYNVTPNGIQ